MDSKKEFISYLDNVILFVLGIVLLAFPLALTTITTDAFAVPKQALLGITVLLSLILFSVKVLTSGKVVLRRTPFDLPIILFTLAVLLSSVFAVNKADSIIYFTPFLFSAFLYFVIVNLVKDRNSFVFLSASFVTGAVLMSILSILSFFKIYVLPFDFTKTQTFTTLGSSIDQFMYILIALALSVSLAWPLISRLIKRKMNVSLLSPETGFSLALVVLLAGTIIGVLSFVKIQKPTILPFEVGFQTAFAEISQDTGRVAQGFLLGSGFGTYITDFTRFKPVSFNNSELWSFTFIRSSSYVLELLATTGILGLSAFLYLLYKVLKEKAFQAPVVTVFALSFVLPFSFVIQAVMFIILGLYSASQGLLKTKEHKYFDVELHFVALKKVFALAGNNDHTKRELGVFLPIMFSVFILLICGLLGFFGGRYILSDILFQKALMAASSNNGSQTYDLQAQSLQTFGYRDAFYRVFAQTNLLLANSLVSQLPQGSSPSAQMQQTVLTLTQQSINAARQATIVSPMTSSNWNLLSSIYRNLIGFGQNAESFSVSSQQQAIALDPNNPQEYITLGGIYYQLGQWDNAQQQFQIAISLKPNLANAYYNLGHTLEQKGDFKGALDQYEIVKQLVTNDKTNLDVVLKDISSVQEKIGQEQEGEPQTTQQSSGSQAPLEVNTPAAQLPAQNPPVEIPSPPATQSAE